MSTPKAAIFGCAGPDLSAEERAFFRDADPLGFILFARNVDTPERTRRLVDELRSSVARADAPGLIDQEGGRVARLRPPHWRKAPPARLLGDLYARNPEQGLEATKLNSRLLAADVASIGCDVDCVPVLDIAFPETHAVIGDRAYADRPEPVAALGRAAAEGLLAEGVMPVIKHIPGHGRARADSHLELPVVEAAFEDLDARDFAPFRVLSDMPMAMTAHVIYAAVDAKRPATTSRRAFRQVIRGAIGYDGLVMSDDLSMKALAGDFRERARGALAAGCDVVLHCNGDMAEMKGVADGCGALKGHAKRRAKAALGRIARAPEPIELEAARARFAAALQT
jgi:beta-N-acetylhexosaminidase